MRLSRCSSRPVSHTQKPWEQLDHTTTQFFLAPPWPELFETDEDRRHDVSAAVDEFERLQAALEDMGYDIQLLPKVSVEARADFVLETINRTQ